MLALQIHDPSPRRAAHLILPLAAHDGPSTHHLLPISSPLLIPPWLGLQGFRVRSSGCQGLRRDHNLLAVEEGLGVKLKN